MSDALPEYLEQTYDLARRIRAHSLRMTNRARLSHIGTCLSMAEILAVLYDRVLRVNASDPAAPDRDRLLVSKGHGAAIVYAVLAERGFFETRELDDYAEPGSPMLAHVNDQVPGVELATGSLGHALPVACGLSLAAKRDAHDWRTFVILSDGELDEGSNWEAMLFASHHELDNLVAVVDYNKIQSFGSVEEVMRLEPLADKWRAFGWNVLEVDGHDLIGLDNAFQSTTVRPGMPTVVIAHTVKGKGVDFMEGLLEWHYRSPSDEQLDVALKGLGVEV